MKKTKTIRREMVESSHRYKLTCEDETFDVEAFIVLGLRDGEHAFLWSRGSERDLSGLLFNSDKMLESMAKEMD